MPISKFFKLRQRSLPFFGFVCALCVAGSASASEAKDPSFLAVRGTDNCLWVNTLVSSGPWDGWSGYQKVNTPCNLASAPSIAGSISYFNATAHVVYRRNDNHIVDIFTGDVSSGKQPKDMVWSGEQDLGGVTYDAPALLRVPDGANGHLVTYHRGTDNSMWMRTLGTWNDNTVGNWSGWVQVGAVSNMGSAPSVTMWGNPDNKKEQYIQLVYRRESDGHIIHQWQPVVDGSGNQVNYASSDGWSGVDDLGGVTTAAPAGVTFTNGTYAVFCRGTDNNLWVRSWWRSWNNWQVVPTSVGDVQSGITAFSRPSRGQPQMHVFYRDSNNNIQHNWWESSWSHDTVGCCTNDSPTSTLSSAPYYP